MLIVHGGFVANRDVQSLVSQCHDVCARVEMDTWGFKASRHASDFIHRNA